MFSITVSGETLAEVAFNAARLAEELTKQSFVQEQKDAPKDEQQDEPQPETPAPEKTEQPKGRGRRTQTPAKEEPKEEPKDEKPAKPTRNRRGAKADKVVEETEDQKADRQYINECFSDLGDLAQTDTEVRDAVGEVLARNGLANIAELKTDQLDQMLDDVNELMDRFFEPAQQ
jgi:outer membrane biosynthesis protein TonB